MPEFVGFQTMGILVPYGITFDAVDVFGLAFQLLFKSCSTYCAVATLSEVYGEISLTFDLYAEHEEYLEGGGQSVYRAEGDSSLRH